jgi:choline kinase
MKAIILAAGEGRRLHPLTLDKPKAMLEVEGRALIDRALQALRGAMIRDEEIIILSGHGSEKLRAAAPRCIFIHNERFASTNNIYSLFLAGSELAEEEFMLLNSDVLFAPELIKDMLVSQRENVLLIDDVKPLAEEDMKVMANGEGRITAIAKTLDPRESTGEYIGLARFGAEFSQAFFKRMYEMIQAGQTDVWYENAIAEILGDQPIYLLSTQGLPWIEIDTHEDLARAAEIAQKIEKMEV